jgi:hypothetical protein
MAGLFDNIFGGSGGMYADLMTPEQQAQIRKQSMLQMAAKLLESSGPSTVRRTIGQTIGGALSAGAEAMQSGQANAVQQMLMRQKLEEAKAAAARRKQISGILGGDDETVAAMPAMPTPAMPAMPAPVMPEITDFVTDPNTQEMVPSDSVQAQNILMPQVQSMQSRPAPLTQPQAALAVRPPMPAAAMPTPAATTPSAAPVNLRQFVASQPQVWRESLALMSDDDAMKAIQDRQVQSSTYGKPEFFVGQDGNPVAMQYNPFGESRVVPGLLPNEPTPTEIKTLRALNLPVTLAGVIELRKATAANVNVGGSKLSLTPAQEAIDKKFADGYLEWQSGGGADAAANIAQISTVLEQLEQGKPLTGPMIGVQPDLLLNLTNPTAANAKEQVQEVVLRNLRVVLGAQFTAAEGNQLISRAFNPNLTPQQNAARLRKLYQQMSVAAQQKQAMSEYYEANGTLKGYKGKQPNVNDFYKALEVRPAPRAGDVVGGWRFKGGNPNDEANYEKVR